MNYWRLGPYVDLDKNDQGIIAAGGAAGLAAAICIVANGWGCPVPSAVLASAALYIALNGVYPDKTQGVRQLLVWLPGEVCVMNLRTQDEHVFSSGWSWG
jgi:hypothetical protein